MPTPTPTIAIAGAGDLAKYLVEELFLSHTPYTIVVLSRAPRPWFANRPGVTLHITDYSTESILSILNATRATVLFSFLHSNDPDFYVGVHERMLSACRASTACKRFVPSEYGGNVDDPRFAGLPRFYKETHGRFREVLLEEGETGGVEWTLVNGGWFMDYFVNGVSRGKSYMKALPGVWPIDLGNWTAVVLGSGDEKIGWTAARDVARALVALLRVERGGWERHTYVVGEIGTWNRGMEALERFHGRRLEREYKSIETISDNLEKHANDMDPTQLWVAYMDEWNVTGASAVPWVEVARQREKYFKGIKFRSIEELLEDSKTMDVV